MGKLSKGKWLAIVLAVAMVLTFIPALGAADEHEPEPEPVPNYGFIPNSDESSVSKVDLVAGEEIARYSTVPDRDVNLLDARPNRIDIDSEGNAWVLNTMSTTRSNFSWQDAQGSVVRISASPVDGEITDAPNNNTSIEGEYDGMVEGDVRVSIIDIGALGDAPRTINVVEEGDDLYLWIGFYGGRYFEKFAFDPDATDPEDMLEAVAGTKIDVDSYTPYSTDVDGDILWVSAMASSNPFTGVSGIFAIDMTDPEAGYYAGPFAFEPGRPYDIKVAPDGKAWVSDATPGWGTEQERFFGVYDSDDTITPYYVSIGDGSTAMRGFYIAEDGTVWATTANGRLLKGTFNPEQSENHGWTFEAVQTGLPELVGIGPDAAGNLWLIMYGSDEIGKLDPGDPTGDVEEVDVGAGPYAYSNFLVELETGCLSVEKVWEGYDVDGEEVIGFDEDTMIPEEIDILIKGPSFDADHPNGKPFTLEAEEDWSLEVCDLEPGEYFVYEDAEDEDWYDLWDIDIDPVSVTVAAGDEPEVNLVTITNTYQPGCLEITKEWIYGEGDDETGDYIPVDMPDEISVLIEGPSYPDGKVVTLEPEDWSWESCNVLIPGRYFLTELDFEGSEFWSSVYIVDGSAVAGWVDVEPDETAEVTIRNYYLFKDDTIWAYSAYAYDELKLTGDEEEGVVYHNNKVDGNPSNAWGWTNFIDEETVATSVYEGVSTYEFYLFAGAGQNDTERGEMVGTLTVVVEPEICDETGEELDTFCATVTYDVDAPYVLSEYHLWVGDTPLPEVQRGRGTVPTAAPGQFPYGDGDTIPVDLEEGFYVAAHGVIRMPYEPVPEECSWTGVWDTTITGEGDHEGSVEVTFVQDNDTVTGWAPYLVANYWFSGTVEDDGTLSGEWGWGTWELGTFEISMLEDDCDSFDGTLTDEAVIDAPREYDWTGLRQ